MKKTFVSVSFLLFASCIGLLAIEIRTAGAEFLEKEVEDRRQLNLRRGKNLEIESVEENTRSLIVGGNDAKDFPRSIVFLSDRDNKLQCGGTLISPTVVLAAGHCEISIVYEAVFHRFESVPSEKAMKSEIRIKAIQEILHPKYDRNTLQNDVMLVVLERSPNEINGVETTPPIVPYMKLHTPDDPSLQDLLDGIEKRREKLGKLRKRFRSLITFANVFGNPTPPPESPETTALQLKALGWGHTKDGEKGKPSDVLQEVVLNWVPNDECEKAEESEFLSYKNRISDDMFCTWRRGMDTCHGDSGGPIVIENPNYIEGESTGFQFVQVGIVSWGEDCADHIFPGVASRVSVAYDWIRDRACSIDGSKAPSYLNCDDEHTYSPSPTPSPTTVDHSLEAELQAEALALVNGEEASTVRVAVEIFLDIYSFETAWKLVELNTGDTLMNVPYKEYKFDNSDRVEFDLTPGNTYKFTIYDQFGDGIQSKGSYRIYTVDESKYETVGTILTEGDGDFRYKSEHYFTLPKPIAAPETPVSRLDSRTDPSGGKNENNLHEEREKNRIGQLLREPDP